MTNTNFLRLILPLLLTAGFAQASTLTFNFTGTCGDCTGFGPGDVVTAVLTVSDYTQGTDLTASEFVSFYYGGSNLVAAFSFAGEDLFSGNIPTSLPSFALVDILDTRSQLLFSSSTGGDWELGAEPQDYGSNGTWSLASSTPEPAAFGLGLTALAGIGLLRRRKA